MEANNCRRLLTCQGLRALVTANAADVEWLREFVTPHFEFTAEESGYDVEVHLVRDNQRHADLAMRGAAIPHKKLNCFMLDSKTLHYAMWQSADAAITVFDDDANLFYEVRNSGAVTVVGRTEDMQVRVPWMRVVRELAMSHAYGVGKLLLHASACVLGGKGVIITAPSGGGKTTLLMHLLHRTGAKYLTNDRLVVSLGAAGAWARGMPTIVTIRPGTVRMMPEIGDRLGHFSCNHRLTLREAAALQCGPPRPWNDGRIGLGPAQFCELLMAQQAREARPCALILPHITGDAGGCTVRQLSPERAGEILTQTLFAARWLSQPSELFASPGARKPPNFADLAQQCRNLASTIPCLECRLGNSAYDSANCAAHTLAAAIEDL